VVVLTDWWDYLLLFAVAAVLGGLGGLAYELTIGGRGRIEIPRSEWDKGRYRDLGVWANVILGAIVAPAALSIFPPEETVVTPGQPGTVTEWNIVEVVGLSVIVGSAASTFLTAMQARAMAVVKAQGAVVKGQEAQQTAAVSAAGLDAVQKSAEADAPKEELVAQVKSVKAALRAVADSGPGNPTLNDF
jgi:hypothetical protein